MIFPSVVMRVVFALIVPDSTSTMLALMNLYPCGAGRVHGLMSEPGRMVCDMMECWIS